MSSSTAAAQSRAVGVAESHELGEGGRLVVSVVDGPEVGLFRVDGTVHAYENMCPHAGGPVCQGKMMAAVVEVVDEDRKSHGFEFSDTDRLISCPWHGYEFNLATGVHPGDASVALRKFEVDEQDGQITVYV